MPLETVPGEDDILARVRTVPGIDVIEGEYTQDSFAPKTDANKMFRPYALVKFNGSFQSYDNGIVGPEKDTQRATITIYVVSPDDRTSRILRDQIRIALLTDFSPTDGSALRPGNSYSFTDPDLGYHRYVHTLGFSYLTNLS